MRIAYFTNTYPRATDTFIRREVIGLRERGFEVLTYSVRRTGTDHDVDPEVIAEKNNTRYLMPIPIVQCLVTLVKTAVNRPVPLLKSLLLAIKTVRPGVKGWLLQIAYFIEAVQLAAQFQDDNIEHIHNHLGDNSGNVTMFASVISGIPFSISIHGPHIFFEAQYWALREKSQLATFISCIGEYCKSQMMLYADMADWKKFSIVRCGIDLTRFEYRQPATAIKNMVYVGRLSGEKGLPILFQSLQLLKSRDYDFTLKLLGDGEDRQFLQQEAQRMGLADNIEFSGFVDQATIAKELRDSDIFVLPSFAEGIPVALMEAMAIGIPVVATYVGGVAELVVDKETGLTVFPSDIEGLAAAIASYIDDPQLAQQLSARARKKVESEFNTIDQIDKLVKLFNLRE